MMKKTRLMLAALVRIGAYPGATRGELRRAANLPPDTEVTRPLRELRREWNGFDVRCEKWVSAGGRPEFRYWLPVKDRKRAAAMLRKKAA